MSFKLVIKNSNGDFKVNLKRELTNKEIFEICQVAMNILPDTPAESSIVYGPHPASSLGSLGAMGYREPVIGLKGQTKLGEKPVDSINMGGYKEPEDGVRIKMVHMPAPIVPAVKVFRTLTDISMLGCKEIIYGNYQCPILTLETAQKIIEEFHKLNIFAKIVPAFDNIAE
jgi:hypothetical protein